MTFEELMEMSRNADRDGETADAQRLYDMAMEAQRGPDIGIRFPLADATPPSTKPRRVIAVALKVTPFAHHAHQKHLLLPTERAQGRDTTV